MKILIALLCIVIIVLLAFAYVAILKVILDWIRK